ncbi:MAG: hypothetical protein JSW14_05060 [Candidatus Bathyarchaeum sp.]|nr:MAG: hypothetical protein JSW14_05060 [Candidatus Bathyarchaeum sp.]
MRKRLQTFIVSALFVVWIIALLLVYLPISGWIIPTFPFTVDYQYKILLFLTTTAMVSGSFFIKGIQLLRRLD